MMFREIAKINLPIRIFIEILNVTKKSFLLSDPFLEL